MPELTIDIRKSDYSPLFVNLSGKRFEVRKFDKEVCRELNKYDEIVKQGDLLIPYTRLEYLLKLKKDDPFLAKIHPEDINRITMDIIRAVYSADATEMEGLTAAEKKKKSSGGKGRKQ